jgi:beta-lactamase superfamily II metal-dependent hydrolase
MQFTLEALQGKDGDCLLLHYAGATGAPVQILIDGGSQSVFTSVLKPRLDALGAGNVLDLRLVLVTHIDADHITGIIDLFRTLKENQDNGTDPFCRVRTLWHNSFTDLHMLGPAPVSASVTAASLGGPPIAGLDDFTAAVVASVPQGNQLHDYATQLAVPINQSAGGPLVLSPDTGKLVVPMADGLTFTVLAPHKPQLDALQASWQTAQAAHPSDPQAQTADYLNATVPNMSSIVVMAEATPTSGPVKRMLLTGDARGDIILKALDEAGFSTGGRIHVDLLKVQHHGSSHSTTQDFFEKVTADRYVISGNGKDGNPHPDALKWLSAARHGQPYEAYLTNRTGLNNLSAMFDTFLASEAQNEPLHVYHFRTDPALSITIDVS